MKADKIEIKQNRVWVNSVELQGVTDLVYTNKSGEGASLWVRLAHPEVSIQGSAEVIKK